MTTGCPGCDRVQEMLRRRGKPWRTAQCNNCEINDLEALQASVGRQIQEKKQIHRIKSAQDAAEQGVKE